MQLHSLLRASLAVATLAVSGCVGVPAAVQPIAGQQIASQNCYAGFYQCTLPVAGPAGTPCVCPGLGAPSSGVIR